MSEKQLKKPVGKKRRINESQPANTINITYLTGKNPVTFSAWMVLHIIYNIPASSVCSALQITEPFH